MSGLPFAMVTAFYPPYNFGGDGMGIQRLSRALVRRGHHVTAIHDSGAYEMLAGGPPAVKPADDRGPRPRDIIAHAQTLAGPGAPRSPMPQLSLTLNQIGVDRRRDQCSELTCRDPGADAREAVSSHSMPWPVVQRTLAAPATDGRVRP